MQKADPIVRTLALSVCFAMCAFSQTAQLTGTISDQTNSADLQKKFVGSWKLISIEGPNQTRTDKPFGIIMYDNTGHMSVQIVRTDRPTFPEGRAKATDKEKGAAFAGAEISESRRSSFFGGG